MADFSRSRRVRPEVARRAALHLLQLQRLSDVGLSVLPIVDLHHALRMDEQVWQWHWITDPHADTKPLEWLASNLEMYESGSFRTTCAPRALPDGSFDVDFHVHVGGIDQYELTCLKEMLTEYLGTMIHAARDANRDERVSQLLRAIAPPDPLADVELKVAAASTELRREFFERVQVLTSAQVHANAGFPGTNPSQTVHRWRKQGKIFGVSHGGRDWYPGFQFGEDGLPVPIVAELLGILRRDEARTDWDNALWFAGDNGWLDGKTPLEWLGSAPELVKRAAEQEVLRDEP